MVVSKKVKPFIPLIISLLLAFILYLLVEDFLRTVIIGPLLYVIWFVSLIVESLPQGVIWAGFILVMLFIAFASLGGGKVEQPPASQPPWKYSGQVQKWARLLDHKDKFTRWRLATELKRLTRKLLSPSDDLETNNTQDHPELPTAINSYFEAQQPTKTPFWDWINNKNDERSEDALDLDPEVVIQYLEEQLKQ